MQIESSDNPVITFVRDPDHFLGKRFDTNPDGSISKSSNVRLSFGIAVQHHVPTHGALVELLNSVGGDPHAAIINASFAGVEIGEEFIILSEKEIEKWLGIATGDRERQQGVHTIEYNGKPIKAVGRFKENVRPSNWQLLDRDVDSHTPEKYVGLTTGAWLSALASIIPGVDKVSYVETPSSSSRVSREGKPVGQGNGHIWMYVNDPDDIERFRSGIIILAAQADMTWLKPRYSSTEEGKVVGNSLTTIIDPSVFSPERLVFDGQPTASAEFTVSPLNAVVHQREHVALDTVVATLPDAKTIKEITRKAGVVMSVRMGSNGLKCTTNDLTLDSEIETKPFGIITVRELIKQGTTEKIRCQTPFRASESWAAFYSVNPDGIPFVYDNGTCTTHWLNEFEAEDVKLIPATAVVEQLIHKVQADSAAVLEDDAVKALATRQRNNGEANSLSCAQGIHFRHIAVQMESGLPRCRLGRKAPQCGWGASRARAYSSLGVQVDHWL